MVDGLVHDTRHAWRHLRRSPLFTVTALLTLAIGIGANVAMLSLLNAVVLRPVPVKDPDRLVAISSVGPQGMRAVPAAMLVELSRETRLWESVCGYNSGGVLAAEANGSPGQALVEVVTGQCLPMLGVSPQLGRTFTDGEAPPDGRGLPVAVLGHGFWQRAFGGDPGVLGRTVTLEGVTLTVVGVMPPAFTSLQVDIAPDITFPVGSITVGGPGRPPSVPYFIARLRPGVSIEAVSAELATRWPAVLAAAAPSTLTRLERDALVALRVSVEPVGRGFSFLRRRYSTQLASMVALTGVLVLLACLNVGALLLARLASREQELAVRLALGASSWRLVRQCSAEALLLSACGTLLALPLAWWLAPAIAASISSSLLVLVPATVDVRPDLRVLALAAATAITCGALAAALPAWVAGGRRAQLASPGGRTVSMATGTWSRAMLVAQIALSLVIVSGAGLLAKSLHRLRAVNPGFRTGRVLVAGVLPRPGAYRDLDNAASYPALIDRLSALPGVISVGTSRVFPNLLADQNTLSLVPVARADAPMGEGRGGATSDGAMFEAVSPRFFETVGIPVLRGRPPSWRDDVDTPQVALLNETLASRLFPHVDPIGRRIRFGTDPRWQALEVVGIVGDASFGNLRAARLPVVYRPALQERLFARYPRMLIRTDGDPAAIVNELRQVVAAGGVEYVHGWRTLEHQLETSLSRERLASATANAAAALAVLLAFIGIHSALAYAVSRRTREIGVRMAVGADRGAVLGMIVRESLVVAGLGVALGVPVAVAAGRFARALLFEVSPGDPATLAVAAVFFLTVAVCAGWIPARRAASVNPVTALRAE